MHTLGIALTFPIIFYFFLLIIRKDEERFVIQDAPLYKPCSSCKGVVVHRTYGEYYQYEDDFCKRCKKITNFEVI